MTGKKGLPSRHETVGTARNLFERIDAATQSGLLSPEDIAELELAKQAIWGSSDPEAVPTFESGQELWAHLTNAYDALEGFPDAQEEITQAVTEKLFEQYGEDAVYAAVDQIDAHNQAE